MVRGSYGIVGAKDRSAGNADMAVFMPNWIGDAVMATPALHAVRRLVDERGGTLVGIMRPVIAELLDSAGLFDEVHPYDKRERRGPLSLAGMRPLFCHRNMATIVLLTNSIRTAWWAWRCGFQRRIGYANEGRSWLLTDAVRRARWNGRRLPRSAVDVYNDLVRLAGAYVDNPRVSLTVSPHEAQLADECWEQWNWNSRSVVALHPGAAFGAAKCWPAEHFAAVTRLLLRSDSNLRVLVLCGPGEQETAKRIADMADDERVRTLAESHPCIALTKACIAKSTLLVTGDSGPRHIAAALGTPTVTIFGSTDPVWSYNYHTQETWLQLPLDCRPCAKRECPLGHHRCMRDLTPQSVADAAQHYLQTVPVHRDAPGCPRPIWRQSTSM